MLTLFALLGMHGDDRRPAASSRSTSASSSCALSLYAMVAMYRDDQRRRRGGDEVLRARRAGVGHAALRHVDDLRRHRVARHRRVVARRRSRRAGQSHDPRCSASCSSSPASRSSWARVPYHMWVPGRLRRRADGGDAADRHRARSSPRSRSRCGSWPVALQAASGSTGRAC